MEELSKSEGKDIVIVVVDRFIKYGHFLAISHIFSAIDVVKVFLRNIYKLYRLPTLIMIDKNKVFTSMF